MATRSPSTRFFSGEALVLYLAGSKLLFHLLTANRYGIFRDELYYLACGEHLDWGYVDQPPLIGLVAFLIRHTLGTSLYAIRIVPILGHAAIVNLTAILARRMGASRFAQILAGLCVMIAPLYLALGH